MSLLDRIWPARRAPIQVVTRKKRDRAGERQRAAERRRAKLTDAKTKIELARMEKELKRLESGEPDDDDIVQRLRLSDVSALNKQLHPIGLKLQRIDGQDDDGNVFKAAAKVFGQAVGEVAIRYATQQQGANGAAPPSQVPALPPDHAQPPEAGADSHVERLIAQLVQMTPMEAADWLRSQPPPADQVINALVKTPDERIPELIGQLRAIAPRGANALQGRNDWLIAVAQRLRQASYNAQNPPLAASPL